MLNDRLARLQAAFGSGVAQRATLFANHLLSSEPAALARLVPHAGRRIELHIAGAPAWLQTTPLVFEVTPAGRLAFDEGSPAAPAELRVTLDVSDPLAGAAGWLGGDRGALTITGDDGFAADVGWLVENLRWNIADDLEPVVGSAAAGLAERAGANAAALTRGALDALAALRRRGDPRSR